jgi:hypothetical protein
MKIEEGQKAVVTTDGWFFAPDGQMYRAVFGTVKGIRNDEETLGIKTNKGSTNWYLEIGNMLVAGCQIHYAVKTDSFNPRPYKRNIEYNGRLVVADEDGSNIYNADV